MLQQPTGTCKLHPSLQRLGWLWFWQQPNQNSWIQSLIHHLHAPAANRNMQALILSIYSDNNPASSQSPTDRALGMTRSSVCSYCFCSMGAHFPSPSTIPLLSTTYQQQEPRVSHHLWKQVTVEIDFSSVFYLINSYFSHDFMINFTFQMHEYFYILYSNNDRPSVQQHRYYNCYTCWCM